MQCVAADPADVVHALATKLPKWSISLLPWDDLTFGAQSYAVVLDDLGQESWVLLDVSVAVDPSMTADEVAEMIMENEHWV